MGRAAVKTGRGTWILVAPIACAFGIGTPTRAQISVEPVPQFEEPREFVGSFVGSNFRRPFGLASGDFNDDGFPDVVVAVRGYEIYPAGLVFIFENLGNGAEDWNGFDEPTIIVLDDELITKPYHVVVANLDPDVDPFGMPDFAVAASASNEVFVFLNDGSGDFGPPGRFDVPEGFAPRGIAAGYFGNSTTRPSLAVASDGQDKVAFLDNVGGTGDAFQVPFNGVKTLGTGVPAYGVVGGEFDTSGAGNEDALTPDWASDPLYGCEWPGVNDSVSVLANEGDYGFTVSQENGDCGDVPWNFRGIAKGRFHGTGENDIVAIEECRAFVNIIRGDGMGGFSHNCTTDQYQMHASSGPSIHGVATGHLNGGTKMDIAVTLKDTNQVSLLLGKGDGTFQHPPGSTGYLHSIGSHADSSDPVQLIIVDLDQDGFGDIVTSNEGWGCGSCKGSLSVLINEMIVVPPP